MPSYSAQIDIAAPAADVFARVADIASHGTWSADPLEVTPAGDGRFRSSAVSKGKTITADIVVAEQQPPSRFVFDVNDATGSWRHTFTVVSAGATTRVTRTIAGRLSGAQLVLYWLVLLPIKKPNARRSLERLKQVCEQT